MTTLTLLIAATCIIISIITLLIKQTQSIALQYTDTLRKRKRITIGILTPSLDSPHDLFVSGFVSHLKKYASFDFEVLECNGNADLSKYSEWARFLATHKDVDLIYAIGKVMTKHISTQMQRQQRKIPIISGGIPLEIMDIPVSEQQKDVPLTGVTTTLGWHEKIASIKHFLPDIKNVLVLFAAEHEISQWIMKEKNIIAAAMRKNHLNMHIMNLSATHPMSSLTKEALKNIDLIVISRLHSTLMKKAMDIAQHAARFNVPVFSPEGSHALSVFISAGSTIEKRIGISCAKKAIKILEDKVDPQGLPFKQIDPLYIMQLNLTHTGFIGMKKNMTRLLSRATQVTISLRK